MAKTPDPPLFHPEATINAGFDPDANHHVHVQNLDNGWSAFAFIGLLVTVIWAEVHHPLEAVAWLIDAIGKIVEDFQSGSNGWRR